MEAQSSLMTMVSRALTVAWGSFSIHLLYCYGGNTIEPLLDPIYCSHVLVLITSSLRYPLRLGEALLFPLSTDLPSLKSIMVERAYPQCSWWL